LVLCVAFGSILAVPPLNAGEPDIQFLDAMRGAGYYDEALLYLKRMSTSPLATSAFRQAIPYQRGMTLIGASRRTTDNLKRTRMLRSAEVSLREFVDNHSQHPLRTQAQIQLGNVLVEKAVQQMELGQRGDNKSLIASARNSFKQAHGYFSGLRDGLKARLDPINTVQFDPSQKEQKEARDKLRTDYLQSLVYVASVLEAAAGAEDEDSEERKKLLEQAAGEFGTIYKTYRRRTVGLYSRLYQGRCLQKLGQELDALSLYTDLFDQPDAPVFREIKLQAIELAMRIWLDDKHKKYAEAVSRGSAWLRSADREERNSQRGCAIRLALARGNVLYATYLDEKQPGNTQANQLRSDAKEVATELTKIRNAYQQEARELLADIRGGGAVTTTIPRAATFAEARDLSHEAMQEFQNATYLVAMLPERILYEKSDDEKKKLSERLEQSKADAARFRQQALVNLELALRFTDTETPQDELNLIRVFLAQIYLSHARYHDTAVIGEFLARHYSATSPAKPAAQLALSAYQQIARADPASEEFARGKLRALGQFMLDTWPAEPETVDAALVLISFAVEEGDLNTTRQLLQRIPETAKKRGVAERIVGRALWAAFLRVIDGQAADQPRSDEAVALANDAMETLAAGCGKLTSDEPIDVQTGLSALALAQAYLENRRAVDAMKVMDASGYGPMQLITGQGAFVNNSQLIEESLRTALLSYVGAANEKGASQKIKVTMVALKKHTGTDPDGKKRLIGTLVSVAQSLQKQLAAATPEQRRSLAISFATFLEQVGKEATDFRTLFWVADSFRTLATSSDGGTGQPPAEATEFYNQAQSIYDDILNKGKADSAFFSSKTAAVQIKLRLVTVKRRLYKFTDAMQLLVEILSEHPNMVNVQQEAALTYQEWAGFPKGRPLYLKAVSGAYPDKNRKNDNSVWGWAKIARLTQGNRKFLDVYFQARLKMSECRYEYGLSSTGAAEKKKYLSYAKQDISFTSRQFPDLGGDKSRAQFDVLLRKIQAALKEPQRGLAAFRPKK
jgi:hypothetical protein